MFLSRRRFLVEGVRITALVPTLAGLTRGSGHGSGERVLVVLQLTGGNDGLNTVVPHRQDPYYRLRPTLALEPAKLHALDAEHGLHPSLGELRELFDRGRLTVLQGVGYPDANRSHFRALEIWHSAEPEAPARGLGWLGRMADQITAVSPGAMPAMHVGDEDLPLAMRGRRVYAPTVRDEDSLQVVRLPGLEPDGLRRIIGDDEGPSDLAFLRTAARGAHAAAERLERALGRPGRSDYPDLPLAHKLRLIARLVANGFDTRLFLVTLGGFDTHARQGPLHAALLTELSRSLAAFERDLAAAGAAERVLTLVYSEFGRRVEENASRGTDHGAAAPVFLLGGPGRGMRGTPPDLGRLSDGDIGFRTDFRALYGALERDWMGLEPSTAIPAIDLAG